MAADEKTREDLEARAREIARQLGAQMPEGVGFTLLLFTYEPGWSTYISSAQRGDMLRALQELVARFRHQELPPPTMQELDDVADAILATVPMHRDVKRVIAATAIAFGASSSLARAFLVDSGGR